MGICLVPQEMIPSLAVHDAEGGKSVPGHVSCDIRRLFVAKSCGLSSAVARDNCMINELI